MASKGFSIDDAFESDDDEKIRTYGSTVETKPLHSSRKTIATVDVRLQEHLNGKSVGNEVYIPVETNERDDLLQSPLNHGQTHGAEDGDGSVKVVNVTYQTKPSLSFSWLRHPKIKENWKFVLMAFLLLLMGIGLVIVGIVIEFIKPPGVASFIFFIIGIILIIPGAYHVIYVYCAVKGRRGFQFYNIPNME
ncbi:transmembrane protein 134-like [Tubulanus polymorphus]|uniref:transmembrane protein 134-like n=1 Tax=Tubulanus polymorphus TaxID=672921 RepID=UPI003DA26AE3